MKLIMIFLRPNCYFKTKEALNAKRYFAMNTKEVLGRGKAHVSFIAGEGSPTSERIYENALIAKKMIQIVVPDSLVDDVIDTVLSVNSHNNEGDGKIFVLPVDESIRIHTGETGEDSLI